MWSATIRKRLNKDKKALGVSVMQFIEKAFEAVMERYSMSWSTTDQECYSGGQNVQNEQFNWFNNQYYPSQWNTGTAIVFQIHNMGKQFSVSSVWYKIRTDEQRKTYRQAP